MCKLKTCLIAKPPFTKPPFCELPIAVGRHCRLPKLRVPDDLRRDVHKLEAVVGRVEDTHVIGSARREDDLAVRRRDRVCEHAFHTDLRLDVDEIELVGGRVEDTNRLGGSPNPRTHEPALTANAVTFYHSVQRTQTRGHC